MPRRIAIEMVRTLARATFTPGATNYATLWHVRVRAANGRVVFATETYASKTGARKAANWIKTQASLDARIVEVDEG